MNEKCRSLVVRFHHMINPDILAYIDQSRKSGVSDEQIEKALMASGWQLPVIKEALAPTTATAPASTIPSPPVIRPPATLVPTLVERPSKKLPIIIGSVAVIILLGGTAFASYMGWVTLPFTSKQPTLQETVKMLALLNSANTTFKSHIAVQPKNESTPVLDMTSSSSKSSSTFSMMAESMLTSLPADAVLDLTASSDWARGIELTDSNSSFDGSYSAGSLSIAIAADVRTTGGYTYIHPTKLPSFIVDFSGVVNKWIRLKDFSSASLSGGSTMFKTEYESSKTASTKKETEPDKKKTSAESFRDTVAELNLLMEKGEQNGAFKISSVDAGAKVGGRPAWKMAIDFDPVLYRAAFKTAYDERSTRMPDNKDFGILTDEALASLDEPAFQSQMETLSKALKLTLYVDKKTRFPSEISIEGTLAVDGAQLDSLKDRQMQFTSSLDFTKANEVVSVATPEDWITPQEATAIISGTPKAETFFNQQVSNIEDIRQILAAYKEKNGRYPDTLASTVGFTWTQEPYGISNDDVGFSQSTSVGDSSYSTPRYTVVSIADDVYTNKPYIYVATADSYSLKYEMRLAGIEAGGYGSSTTDNYVETTNTATEKEVSIEGKDPVLKASLEAARLSKLQSGPDGDGDGLSDTYEEELGTDPKKKDTDGDGFTDKQEIDSGNNPVGRPTTAFGIARMESRDSKRVADVKQIQTAFELFWADHNRYPPAIGVDAVIGGANASKICDNGLVATGQDCGTVYMGNVPSGATPVDGDCSKTDNQFRYSTNPAGTDYTLKFCLGDSVGDIRGGKNTATMNGISTGFINLGDKLK